MAGKEESAETSPSQSQTVTNELVGLASRLTKWAIAQTPLGNDYQISFTQVSALYAIRYGANTPGRVAARMDITPRAATSHVDVLEDKGLLKRSIDAKDRRRTILTLTPEGVELSQHIETTALTELRAYIESMSTSERNALETTLQTLERFLKSVSPSEP